MLQQMSGRSGILDVGKEHTRQLNIFVDPILKHGAEPDERMLSSTGLERRQRTWTTPHQQTRQRKTQTKARNLDEARERGEEENVADRAASVVRNSNSRPCGLCACCQYLPGTTV